MTNEPNFKLTEQGRQRREDMLVELTPRVVRAARARRIRSGAGAAAALLLVASLSIIVPISADLARNTQLVSAEPAHESRPPAIQIIQTDASVIRRLSARDDPTPRVQRISDEELIFDLAAIGRPSGLVHSQGRTWLTAKVTDEQLDATRQPTSPASSS